MVAQIDLNYFIHRPTKLASRLTSYAIFEGRPLTTKGQWINPLIFSFFSVAKKIPQLKKVKSPLFILGTGRSGTTILGVVLSMHQDVGFLNEPKAIWHSIYPNEDIIGNYTRDKAYYRLDQNNSNDNIKQAAHRLYGTYLATVLSKRVVDKYPELVFRVPFVRQIFPDAKFIFLVRNGWDTCASIDKWSSRCGEQKNGEIHDWWGADQRKWKLMINELIEPDSYFKSILGDLKGLTKHTDMAALEWIVTMREGLLRLKENPNCMLMLRYEDLIDNPRLYLSNISEFADFSHDEKYLSYGQSTLIKTPKHLPFDLHPCLTVPFNETMNALGYQ